MFSFSFKLFGILRRAEREWEEQKGIIYLYLHFHGELGEEEGEEKKKRNILPCTTRGSIFLFQYCGLSVAWRISGVVTKHPISDHRPTISVCTQVTRCTDLLSGALHTNTYISYTLTRVSFEFESMNSPPYKMIVCQLKMDLGQSQYNLQL